MIFNCVALMISLLVVPSSTQEVGTDFQIDEKGQAWLSSLFYIPSEPRVRREYRMLSAEERYMINDAFVKMKNDTSVKPNKYDLFVSLHARRSTRNSAHRGTGFLGWHRVYTLLMENAMREWYPNITLSYWDTTLDAVLDLPRESSFWSEDFMGNGNGFVDTGVFKDWTTQRGYLYRTVGALYGPLEDRNISYMFQFDHIGNISYPMSGKNVENIFEEIHNRVHHFVGGEMRVIETAADDPVFFPYHSFISFVWQEFRSLQREKGIDPETDWDEHYGLARHHKYSPMGLGNLMAIDGSSEIFAENIVFDQRPYCSRENPDCGTPYLYCNVTVEKCCPWTTREYDIIKTESTEKNISFTEAVFPFILNNVQKGFSEIGEVTDSEYDPDKDLFKLHEAKHTTVAPPLVTTRKAIDNVVNSLFGDEADYHTGWEHNHNHDHDHHQSDEMEDQDVSYEEDSDEHGPDHSHHHHEHNHGNVIQHIHHDHVIYNSNDFWSNYLTLILLGSLMTFRIIFTIVNKCRQESVCCCKKRQKYEMDGIVNINFDDDENQKKNNTNAHVSRSDNVYTITVTSNEESQLEHDGRYVRFVKYENGKTEKAVENADPQPKTVNSGSSGNYLDMTYTNVYCNGTDKKEDKENSPLDDMFENESAADEEIDESYNSIENENFDYIRQAIREAEGDRSEDSFDVFDAYDNMEFKREADRCMGIKPDCDEDFYVNYFPGTHM